MTKHNDKDQDQDQHKDTFQDLIYMTLPRSLSG